jgi:hypothetical protein
MKIEVTDVRNELDDAFVASQLGAYNVAFTVKDFKLLRVFARDAHGSVPIGNIWKFTRSGSARRIARRGTHRDYLMPQKPKLVGAAASTPF